MGQGPALNNGVNLAVDVDHCADQLLEVGLGFRIDLESTIAGGIRSAWLNPNNGMIGGELFGDRGTDSFIAELQDDFTFLDFLAFQTD